VERMARRPFPHHHSGGNMNSIHSIARPTRTAPPGPARCDLRFAAVKRQLLVGASAAALAACNSMPPAAVPAALAVPAGQSLATAASAKGVQIYECRKDKGLDAWVFTGPEATLFDTRGREIGSHGLAASAAGPFWQATDGSRIVGAVKGRAEAPQDGAIAWLLLSTTAEGPQGTFSTVKSVQRVNTVGGLPPKEGCAPGTYGQRTRVPYTATYRFFVEQNRTAGLGY
jgi:Protein of unknown function (DUF3455)